MKRKTRAGSGTTWTDFRVEVQNISDSLKLNIKPLSINEWQAVEYRVISHFTGDERIGMTWMWENRIKEDFEHYEKMIEKWQTLADTLKAIIPTEEPLWLFLEDNLHLKTKFWGYSGNIGAIIALLGELPLGDFYIVSKKLQWLVGQNHSDVLFAYGELARTLEDKVKDKTVYAFDMYN